MSGISIYSRDIADRVLMKDLFAKGHFDIVVTPSGIGERPLHH